MEEIMITIKYGGCARGDRGGRDELEDRAN
jgi:hypothetical protein